MAKRMIDRFTDLFNTGSLLFGHGKKLFPGTFPVYWWLIAQGFFDLWMHPIDQCLGELQSYSFGEDSDSIEKREIGWVATIRGNTCRINEQ